MWYSVALVYVTGIFMWITTNLQTQINYLRTSVSPRIELLPQSSQGPTEGLLDAATVEQEPMNLASDQSSSKDLLAEGSQISKKPDCINWGNISIAISIVFGAAVIAGSLVLLRKRGVLICRRCYHAEAVLNESANV